VRVHRSFAFIDLSGFTAYTARQGDERSVSLLSSFRTVVRDICSRRGVRVAKWLGDGAMFVSVEPTPLLATLLEVERSMRTSHSELQVRCGATDGDVILHEGDDYIGSSVNIAARLCDLAPGGEVYVSVELAKHRPLWSAASEVMKLEIKGFSEALEVVSLGFADLGNTTASCPVCRIPLNREVADSIALDPAGVTVLFCSDSCRETWERRPRLAPEQQGSLRTPLMGW
jgi:class 3 adenylate cyclase